MKTFLFISQKGESLPLAQRIYDEGNRVLFCTPDAAYEQVGVGLIERIAPDDLDNITPDIVIFDSPSGHLDDAKLLKKRGILSYGSSTFGEQLSTSKLYANKFMRAHGLKVPRSALEFKPSQCVEVVVECWFSDKSPNLIVYSFDEGEYGAVSKLGKLNDKLFSVSIGTLISTLRKSEFSGQISMRVVVTKDELYAYERIPYFNYATLYSLLECLKGSISTHILGMANGNAKRAHVKNYWFMGSRIASASPKKGQQIKGLNEQNLKHIWLYDVYLNGSRNYAIGNGDVGFVTARGDTPREARRRVLRTVGNLGRDIMCRRDIGERVERDYSLLQSWGWLK